MLCALRFILNAADIPVYIANFYTRIFCLLKYFASPMHFLFISWKKNLMHSLNIRQNTRMILLCFFTVDFVIHIPHKLKIFRLLFSKPFYPIFEHVKCSNLFKRLFCWCDFERSFLPFQYWISNGKNKYFLNLKSYTQMIFNWIQCKFHCTW